MVMRDTLSVMRRGKPSMTEVEADRVRAIMRQLLAEKYDNNRTSLGKAIGMSQSAVTQILGSPDKDIAPKNRPSSETARVIAELAGLPDRFWETGARVPVAVPATPPAAPERVYESDRDANRRGSLLRVRELLYSRFPKRAVDEAIGSSEFIGAENIDELQAFDYFDRLLAAHRFEAKHGRPRLGERVLSADEDEPPFMAEEDEHGKVHITSPPPKETSADSRTESNGDEHRSEHGGAPRKLPRAGKAPR
jgi:hypothetical protein